MSEVDWDKCVLCQKDSSEKLRCPFDSLRSEADSWYDSLCLSIKRSRELACLPFKTRLLTLDFQKDKLSKVFLERRAKWQKLWRNKFSGLKLEREFKRKASGIDVKDDESRKKLPRRSTDTTTTSQNCFFCEESSRELHRASNFNLDRNVRESASILNDTSPLGKLSTGDMVALDAFFILSVYHSSTIEQQESKIKLSHKMTRTLYIKVNWFHSLKNAEVIQMKIQCLSCPSFQECMH